ncbi:hypothetical protein FH968_23480 [Buttiauxella sp. B2]|uniref:hypothetical protein n=1 Tax=Buttiauxella sp. B2 TaxID=2587812 RepID=UPI00111CD959|nr:hypothetical protein [Buttiauxella sp. B2]TNV09120.1 hypothetical protein FH968_23480 [Buttiauxella sp. B2]
MAKAKTLKTSRRSDEQCNVAPGRQQNKVKKSPSQGLGPKKNHSNEIGLTTAHKTFYTHMSHLIVAC